MCEGENDIGPLRVGSGEGPVTIISGKRYGANSESAWNRKQQAKKLQVENSLSHKYSCKP